MAVLDRYDGNLGGHRRLIEQLLKTEGTSILAADDETFKAAKEKTRLAYRACMALNASYNLLYNQLKNYLDNQFLMGQDAYPTTYEETLKLLDNFHSNATTNPNYRRNTDHPGIAFQQQEGKGNVREKNNNANNNTIKKKVKRFGNQTVSIAGQRITGRKNVRSSQKSNGNNY